MAAKVVCRGVNRIEGLPLDDLQEIMIRVAQQPRGAIDIAKLLSVSKTFGEFAENKIVLQAVSFKDLSRKVTVRFELFSDAGGLLARCARAGNVDAQFLLAKVIMSNASNLCCARMEAIDYDGCVDRFYPDELSDLDSSARFLYHYSARDTDPTELLDLVRNFLCRAKVWDLVDMQHDLNNFVALYSVPGRKRQHREFIDILNKMCKCPVPFKVISNPLRFYADQFNTVCTTGYNILKSLEVEEERIQPLMQCIVQMNEDVDYEAVIRRLDIVKQILETGRQAVSELGSSIDLLTSQGNITFASIIRRHLRELIEHHVFFDGSRDSLLESYDALFSM